MPVACESVRVIGPDSIMSSALPAGGPSKMSVKTTSANSMSTIRCAVVDPTKPPPTTVTFFLLMPLLVSRNIFVCEACDWLTPDGNAPHILDDCRRKRGRAHFRRTRHQALEIVSNALLLNGSRDAIFNQRG